MKNISSYRFGCVVWGETFLQGFLDYCLASMLTPGNLDYIASREPCYFRIYTRPKDVKVLKASPTFKKLCGLMTVEIAIVSGIRSSNKYKVMNQCHSHFISTHSQENAALIFVCPDVVWADNSCKRLHILLKSGIRLVAIFTPRLAKETFLPYLRANYGSGISFKPIQPRDLVEMGCQHLNPEILSMLWNSNTSDKSYFTGGIYWRLNEGLLVRQFQPFPLAVVPRYKESVPDVSIDSDYSFKACPDFNDVYVVTDSDEMCLMDFTSSKATDGVFMTTDVVSIAKWAKVNLNPHNLKFFSNTFKFHAKDTADMWNEAEKESDTVSEEILSMVETITMVRGGKLSPTRYFSPFFLSEKMSAYGFRGLLAIAGSRIKKLIIMKIMGDQVTIHVTEKMIVDSDISMK